MQGIGEIRLLPVIPDDKMDRWPYPWPTPPLARL
jgi:hypothetical protein